MNNTQSFITENKEKFLDQLFDLLRIPSISAKPEHKGDMLKTAEVVKQSLIDAGVDIAEICETPGNPVVYGEKIIDPKLPTVVVYGHYDVQPADPLDLWDSPAFEPVIKKIGFHITIPFMVIPHSNQ